MLFATDKLNYLPQTSVMKLGAHECLANAHGIGAQECEVSMILNFRNWANAKATLGRLQARLDLLRYRRGSWKEMQNWQFEAEWLEKRIAEISLELEEYNRLESQSGAIPPLESLLQVPDYLIKRRIRSGISQIELAKRLGFCRNSILIYERTRYAGATLSRILQIDALMKELETTRELEISRFLESAP